MANCKFCKIKFNQRYINIRYCLQTEECIKEFNQFVKNQRQKAYKKETKEKKEAIMSRSEWLNIAQKVFNLYIRTRDKALPCISCGTNKGQFHAGHYRSVGSSPHLRFNENNCHAQCATCNNYLSGNLILYRKNIIFKIGLSEVEIIESDQGILKLSIPEIKELIAFYKAKIKQIQKDNTT